LIIWRENLLEQMIKELRVYESECEKEAQKDRIKDRIKLFFLKIKYFLK
jgi:hypothetical protein